MHDSLIDSSRHLWQRDVTFQMLLKKDRTPDLDEMNSRLQDIRRSLVVKVLHVVEIPAGSGQDQQHFGDITQLWSSSLSDLVSFTAGQGRPSHQEPTSPFSTVRPTPTVFLP